MALRILSLILMNLRREGSMKSMSSNLQFENQLSTCLKTEENHEILSRDDRWQDLPDAHWFIGGSPATKSMWGIPQQN
jgi:hypothetical protein